MNDKLKFFYAIIISIGSPLFANAELNVQNEKFYSLQTKDLDGKRISIPDDLKAGRSCLIIAFDRKQQAVIDTWTAFLKSYEKEHTDFKYFEIPVIQAGFSPARWFIDGAMARSIKTEEGKKRTLTSYTNVEKFVKEMSLDKRQITLFILNSDHRITGKVNGAYNNKSAEEIRFLLEHQ